jgi:hypothetical protein
MQDYLDKTAHHIRNYAQDAKDQLLDMHGIRAMLLDASKACVMATAFSAPEIKNQFQRLTAGIQMEYGVASQMLFNEAESQGKPKPFAVAVWQNRDGDIAQFYKAVESVKALTNYLGFTRYRDQLGTLTKTDKYSKSLALESATSLSVMATNGMATIKHALTATAKASQSSGNAAQQQYMADGSEPSAIMLKFVENALGFPSPKSLFDSVTELNFVEMIKQKDFNLYRRLAVAELTVGKLAKSMMENMAAEHNKGLLEDLPYELRTMEDATKKIRFTQEEYFALNQAMNYCDAGYTREALQVIQNTFPPTIPPSDMDIIYHVILYGALVGGARRVIDTQVLDLIQRKEPNGNTATLDYDSQQPLDGAYSAINPQNDFLKSYPGFVGQLKDSIVIRPSALSDGNNPSSAKDYLIYQEITKTPRFSMASVLESHSVAKCLTVVKDGTQQKRCFDIMQAIKGKTGRTECDANIADKLVELGLPYSAKKIAADHLKEITSKKDATLTEKQEAKRIFDLIQAAISDIPPPVSPEYTFKMRLSN